jgi:hypothetical protein
MLLLVRKFFWIAVGIAGALAADDWLNRQKVRFSPHAMTGSLLNEGLESRSRS